MSAASLTNKAVDLATSGCLIDQESERITNTKAYETMFTVAPTSKFGGLKKRSQVLQRVSGMESDTKDVVSSTATISVNNLDKICNFR
jgi:hypothetical protein